jgi:hypothetical protein
MRTIEVINKTKLKVLIKQGRYITLIKPAPDTNNMVSSIVKVDVIKDKDVCDIEFKDSENFIVTIHGDDRSDTITRNVFVFEYGKTRDFKLNEYDNVFESKCIIPMNKT